MRGGSVGCAGLRSLPALSRGAWSRCVWSLGLAARFSPRTSAPGAAGGPSSGCWWPFFVPGRGWCSPPALGLSLFFLRACACPYRFPRFSTVRAYGFWFPVMPFRGFARPVGVPAPGVAPPLTFPAPSVFGSPFRPAVFPGSIPAIFPLFVSRSHFPLFVSRSCLNPFSACGPCRSFINLAFVLLFH